MTVSSSTQRTAPARQITILLFSDDRTTRDTVRMGVGNRPSPDVHVERWHECATAPGVELALAEDTYDLLILDGEAQPFGGLGLCRQLKNEVFNCPPVLVLTGRPNDGWLAAWSQADGAVAHPLDPTALAATVTRLAPA
ncbi:MAG: hypothetical protein WBG57_04515 [Ornithinimicrobium sp.]